MSLTEQLNEQLLAQFAHLHAATPRIRATEALAKHLQSASITANAHAQLDDDGCSVVLFISASYDTALNALEHIFIAPNLITELDTALLKIRSYTALVHGEQINLVISPEINTSATQYASEIHTAARTIDEYQEAA